MNRNCRRKTEKVYVKVTSDFDATGYMQPRQITWGRRPDVSHRAGAGLSPSIYHCRPAGGLLYCKH